MEPTKVWADFVALPLEAQRQAADFIAFLHQRYVRSPAHQDEERGDLAQEGFIGMWRDREDMQDSSAWVRRIRERDWARDHD